MRYQVAFFGHQLVGGTPRGALRAFRFLAEEIARQEDIDLICLGEPVSDPGDPLGSAYQAFDGRMFLATLDHGLQSTPAVIRPQDHAQSADAWPGYLQGLRAAYRKTTPLWVRHRLQPAFRVTRRLLLKSRSPAPSTGDRTSVAGSPGAPHEELFTPSSAGSAAFRNADIIGQVVSLGRIELLLNFWWFHTPHPHPLLGRYRPPGLKVVAWFLDAIPLRIPHWQPGMIPVPEFRRHVQAHLEAADEIVAISQSAAADVRTFFPHIRKPVHVVPCGVSEQDFNVPAGLEYVCTRLGIDPSLPLFAFIGFQEPSKNVTAALHGLVLAAERSGRVLQALIIGPHPHVDLTHILGPIARSAEGRVRVLFAGLVSDHVRRALLALSTALIYASKWEGFGIPPIEAMAVGTQLVASDIPPIREVCGELPDYCDPYDIESIAAAVMRTLARAPAERTEYAARARQHALGYTWAKAVKQLRHAVLTARHGQTLPSAAPQDAMGRVA